jgi:hypothetical protein
MLASAERGDGEFSMRRGRRRDVDDLHVVARGECVDIRADRHSKFLSRLARGLRDRVGYGGCAQQGIAANSRRQKRPNAPHPSSPTRASRPVSSDSNGTMFRHCSLLLSGSDVIKVSRFVHLSFYVRTQIVRARHGGQTAFISNFGDGRRDR